MSKLNHSPFDVFSLVQRSTDSYFKESTKTLNPCEQRYSARNTLIAITQVHTSVTCYSICFVSEMKHLDDLDRLNTTL